MPQTDTDIAGFIHPPGCKCAECGMRWREQQAQKQADQAEAERWASDALRRQLERNRRAA